MCQPFGWVPVSFTSGGPYGPRGVFFGFWGGVPKVYTRTNPNIHITKCTCSLILRPKGRAETLQLTYSCQLLAVYIQYKHINYTDISQIKYKHICYKILIKVYCVKYKVLDICFWHLENTFQLNFCYWTYSANYWGDICHLEGFFPGAQLSGAQLSGGPTVRGPIVHFVRADSWAPDSRAPGKKPLQMTYIPPKVGRICSITEIQLKCILQMSEAYIQHFILNTVYFIKKL